MNNDSRLPSRVLPEHSSAGPTGLVGDCLSPVVLNKLFRQLPCFDDHGIAGIIARRDSNVGDGENESVLIGRNKLALRQEALDVGEELHLVFSGGFHRDQYGAFSGMIQRTPPLGSGMSPRNRGTT